MRNRPVEMDTVSYMARLGMRADSIVAALLPSSALEAQYMGAMDGYRNYGTSTGIPCFNLNARAAATTIPTGRGLSKSQHGQTAQTSDGCHRCWHQRICVHPPLSQ